MAIPKNKKKKSLLKTEKEMQVASNDFDLYFNKLKELAKAGIIRPPAQVSVYNLYRQDIDEGMSPKDSFKRLKALVSK